MPGDVVAHVDGCLVVATVVVAVAVDVATADVAGCTLASPAFA